MEVRLVISIIYMLVFLLAFLSLWRLKIATIATTSAVFMGLCIAAYLNNRYEFIAEKEASFIAFDIFNGVSDALTFKLQYYVTWPAFWLTNNEYGAHAVNIAVQGLTFLIAMKFILREKAKDPLLLALLIFPAYYNFAIFGLRDPYINLVTTIFVASALNQSPRGFFFVTLLLAAICVFLRPEFSVMLLGFGFLRIYMQMTTVQKVLSVLLYFVLAYVILMYLPVAFGASSTGSISGNIEKLAEFNVARNDRRLGGDGAGSHILGGLLFNYPFFIRYPIQVAASFIAPLPFEIHGAAQALAFVESLIFTFVAYRAWRSGRTTDAGRYLFLCGMVYILGQAIFAINYGNILRIRYPGYIFFIGSLAAVRFAAVHYAPVSGRKSASAQKTADSGAEMQPAKTV